MLETNVKLKSTKSLYFRLFHPIVNTRLKMNIHSNTKTRSNIQICITNYVFSKWEKWFNQILDHIHTTIAELLNFSVCERVVYDTFHTYISFIF